MNDTLTKLLSKSLDKHFKPIKNLDLSKWSEAHVYLPSGTSAVAGKWRTISYQKEIFKVIEDPKVNKITLMFGAQLGKCLALDTPIATPNGFKPLADIKVGDVVFDENGQSCNVVFVTSPMYNKPCYKIRFSDGAEVITDDSHLWQMHYSNLGAISGSRHKIVIKSTKEMVDEGYKHSRIDKHGKNKVCHYYSIDVTKPVKYHKKELAICPYILGLWLGDGISKSNSFTFCGDDYIEFATHIIDQGHNVSVSKAKNLSNSANVRIDNQMRKDPNAFGKIMRNEFGLMKKGKFIPEIYLRASYDDRLSLLQGLMDTDGSVDKAGRCQFSTVFKSLSDGFGDLLGGLGIKYTVKTYYPTFSYKGEKRTGQLVYAFSFTVYDDLPIFRLERKLKRLKSKLAKNTRVTQATRRKIISIEPCQSVPVKCIQVDSPSHLYLCTKWYIPTHNTSIVNNTIGYYIQHKPESQIMMQPSESDVKTWLETKFNPMVDHCPSIQACLAKPRGREGVNNQKMKSYQGGFLMLSWAGSPNTMRGRSAPKIYADEVDGYERTSEGHPVNLLWQRAATFGSKRKLIIASTPTHKGASFVEMSYLSGDQRQYYLPCPHCREYQTLEWKNVTWQSNKDKHDTNTAKYACGYCGGLINDGQKLSMLREGIWRAKMPFNGHASFHLNELYSPFRTFKDIVESFLEKKHTGDLKTFVNVSLAETWEESGERIEPNSLLARVENWHDLPKGVALITAGIDVQQDRIELQAVGWGIDEESWVIDYKIFHGQTSEDEVWQELTLFLHKKRYQHSLGKELPIAFACLDTGGTNNMTSKAYDYVRASKIGLPFAIKGRGGEYPFVTAPSRKRISNKKAFDLYTIGTDEGKSILFNRLKLEDSSDTGVIHFNQSICDTRYFSQLTAEKRVLRYHKGFPKYEWQLYAPDKRNEALDTYVYALAALRITNVDLVLKSLNK